MSSCNVLLVAPGYDGSTFWSVRAGDRVATIPLGLITVAALLPPDWTCRLVDCRVEALTDADIDWADVVMTGGMLPQRESTLAVVRRAQARGRPTVIGGPDATSSPEAYAASDFRVLGEVETILADWVAAWRGGARNGLFKAVPFAVSMADSPIPRFDLLNSSAYLYFGVQFSRGCPFTCEFCDIIELFGRVPRTKSIEQVLGELDALYAMGYRGQVDFVDDNLIGNKKALRLLLPRLIAWQEERGYPFHLSTEASLNLADDDALLALMRRANFFMVFVGIETPDEATLVQTQKKQNTRRSIAQSIHKLYAAGMYVTAGFILGFDSEKGSVAEGMIDCIEQSDIPVNMIGLLYALPDTQLSRRLEREGRLVDMADRLSVGDGAVADQSGWGLNFRTSRPRRDILADHRTVLARTFAPAAFFGRVRRMARRLDCFIPPSPPVQALVARSGLRGVKRSELALVARMCWTVATRHGAFAFEWFRTLIDCVLHNPKALRVVFTVSGMYLHMRPFSLQVIAGLDRSIAREALRMAEEARATAAAPTPLPSPAAPAALRG